MRLRGPRKGIKPSAMVIPPPLPLPPFLLLFLFPLPSIGKVSLEFNGLDADEIKHHPEVETLLVTRDNRTGVMNKVLNWLMEE